MIHIELVLYGICSHCGKFLTNTSYELQIFLSQFIINSSTFKMAYVVS